MPLRALAPENHGAELPNGRLRVIQHTTELSAQRRSCPGALLPTLAPLKAVPTSEKQSFECIADAIRHYDRQIVHIEDDENGAAVRADLRARARSTNQSSPPSPPVPPCELDVHSKFG